MKKQVINRIIFVFIVICSCHFFNCTPKKNYDLYLLIGQSNMAGRATVAAQDTLPHPRVFVFNKSKEWVPAKEPLHFDNPDIVGVGPGFSFAKTLVEHPSYTSSNPIGLIPAACGYTSIKQWLPDQYHEPSETYPYNNAIARTKKAMRSGTLKGIIWHQGETDSYGTRPQTYEDSFMQFYQQLNKDLAINKVPFIVGELGDFYIAKKPQAATINTLLKQIAQKNKNIYFVSANNLTHKGDSLHFSVESYRELGKRYAEELISISN